MTLPELRQAIVEADDNHLSAGFFVDFMRDELARAEAWQKQTRAARMFLMAQLLEMEQREVSQ